MRVRVVWWFAGVAVVILIGLGWLQFADLPGHGRSPQQAALATPVGITVQWTGPLPWNPVTGYDYSGVARQTRAYGDAKGMTLYTRDQDTTPGKSSCTQDCAKTWPAAVAAPDAQPVADWSLVGRDDGSKQWAYRGKPLYTFAEDTKIGDDKGRAVEGAHMAVFQPASGLPLPSGIAVQEVGDANGQALVDVRGHTLYAFGGNPKRGQQACAESACADRWTPVSAPELANTLGEFSIVERDDGIRQWAYKGLPLYRFAGDFEPGDANGIGVDPAWQVALVIRYFMPPQLTIRPSAGFGPILATTAGMSVYWHDAYTYQLGGHGLRRGTPPRPLVGRNIGLKGCDAECLKMWRPLTAPAGSQPCGFWATATREDGSLQWVYKGYALYTYAGDKQPGDLTGNDKYDILISEDPQKAADFPSRFAAAGGLVWIHADP